MVKDHSRRAKIEVEDPAAESVGSYDSHDVSSSWGNRRA